VTRIIRKTQTVYKFAPPKLKMTQEEKLDFILERLVSNRLGNKNISQLIGTDIGADELVLLFDRLSMEYYVKENDPAYTCEYQITQKGREMLRMGGFSGTKKVDVDMHTESEKKILHALYIKNKKGKLRRSWLMLIIVLFFFILWLTFHGK